MYEIYCKVRDSNGMKDYDVAKATGITKSTFSDWKNGRSKPKDAKLQKIADLFGVTAEYIRTGKNTNEYYTNNETAQVAQEIVENKELKALFDVQKDMDPDDLKALHSMALALKRKERGDIDDTGC